MPRTVYRFVRKMAPQLRRQLPPIPIPENTNQMLLVRDREQFYDWRSIPLPRNVCVFFETNYFKPATRNVTAFKACMVTITGPLGTIRNRLCGDLAVLQNGKVCHHSAPYRSLRERKMQCMTTKTTLKNMIYGVSAGWEKRVRLYGKGFRAAIDENNERKLILRCGYARPVEIIAPAGVSFQVLENDDLGYPISIKGIDIEQVGNVAASLKRIKKMNLQGQGIRYDLEERKIRTKKAKR